MKAALGGVLVVALSAAIAAGGTSAPARLSSPSDTAGLAAALGAADTAAFVQELDRLLYEDLVAELPEDRRPARPPCHVALLQASLSTTSALLGLLPDGETTWAVAITRGGITTRRLDAPHTTALGPRLEAWAHDPAGHPYDPDAALAIQNNLLAPFRSVLSRMRHVIVAAGGVLRPIPFETLLMASGEGLPGNELPFLVRRYVVSHEATLGSRLGWSSRPGELQRLRRQEDRSGGIPPGSARPSGEPLSRPIAGGTLPAVAGRPPEGAAVESLRWFRKGARGALLGGSEEGMDAFLRLYFRERATVVRPDVQTVHRVRSALLREGVSVEEWAWPRLFGAE